MADYHAGGKHYKNKMNQSRITNLLGKQLLLARRLCEAGSGFVTVVDAGWDLHGDVNNPNTPEGMAILGPQLDHAVSAFLDDVQERGLSSTSAHSGWVKQREQGRATADGGRAGRVFQTPPGARGLQKPIPATANAAPP
jgi:hypothetical protein